MIRSTASTATITQATATITTIITVFEPSSDFFSLPTVLKLKSTSLSAVLSLSIGSSDADSLSENVSVELSGDVVSTSETTGPSVSEVSGTGQLTGSGALKTRYEHDLCDYFKKYDRTGVRYFVSDMYKPYAEIAEYYFPNATYVIDRYNWVRQAVRKEVQKQFSKKHRIYFKKSRYLLLKHQDKLNDDELQQFFIMLDISPTLSTAYFLKELLYSILGETDPDKQKKLFSDWIKEASESEIPSFVKCAKTYVNWFVPITNSFFCPYTNGFTEGCNNKIKVLKRNAYGLQNFKRFRNRILFMFSHQGGADA